MTAFFGAFQTFMGFRRTFISKHTRRQYKNLTYVVQKDEAATLSLEIRDSDREAEIWILQENTLTPISLLVSPMEVNRENSNSDKNKHVASSVKISTAKLSADGMDNPRLTPCT